MLCAFPKVILGGQRTVTRAPTDLASLDGAGFPDCVGGEVKKRWLNLLYECRFVCLVQELLSDGFGTRHRGCFFNKCEMSRERAVVVF